MAQNRRARRCWRSPNQNTDRKAAMTMPLQCGTQWDALAHVFYDGAMYNGRDIALA